MIAIILLAFVPIVYLLFYIFIFKPFPKPSKDVIEAVDLFPGPKKEFFIGNIRCISKTVEKQMQKVQGLFEEYGPRIRMWFFGKPFLLLFDPDDIQVILKSSQNITKDSLYKQLEKWLGDGLLLSSGNKWFLHRKLLTSAFHFKILLNHEDITNNNCKIFLNNLEKHAQDGKPFDIYPYILNLTLDIICESAMGTSVHAQIQGNEYVKAINRLSSIVCQRRQTLWLRNDFIFQMTPLGFEHNRLIKIVHNFTKEVIQKRKSKFHLRKSNQEFKEKEDEDKPSFLDILLDVSETDERFGDKEIQEEVDTFMFEGHDTTAAAINWCIFLLGNHPDIQDKVIAEVDQAMQLKNNSQRLRELQYLERVIKETLRLYPSVPVFSRELTSPIKLDNLTVPAGVVTPLFVYIVHRNPKLFPNPNTFDPDRFLPERNEARNPYSYIPFSAGPRNCIGQKFAMIECKLTIASLLSRYKIKSLDSPEDVGILPELILKPNRSLKTILIDRMST